MKQTIHHPCSAAPPIKFRLMFKTETKQKSNQSHLEYGLFGLGAFVLPGQLKQESIYNNETIMKLWHRTEEKKIKQPKAIMLIANMQQTSKSRREQVWSQEECAARHADVRLICIIGTPLTFLDWVEGSLSSPSPVTATDGHPLSSQAPPTLAVHSPTGVRLPFPHLGHR